MKTILPFLLLALAFTSCTKDFDIGPRAEKNTREDEVTVVPTNPGYNGLFVLCEGNYNWNNGSMSFLDRAENLIYNDAYYNVNSEILGDVVQSMHVKGDEGYICVDNSHKIKVVNLETMAKTGEVAVPSPRYTVSYGSYGFATSIYGNGVYVYSTVSFAVTDTIAMNGRTEELAIHGNELFVCNPGANQVVVIDMLSSTVVDSIAVAEGAFQIDVDANGKLWVLSNGGASVEQGALYRIDPASRSIELTLDFDIADTPGNLCINGSGTDLYYLNNGVYKMNISLSTLPTEPVIEQTTDENFYGLGIDPYDSYIYVTDAKDYVQNGTLMKFDYLGEYELSYEVGLIPSSIIFR